MEDRPLAVDRQRWERAQAWELAFWRRAQQKRGIRRVVYTLAKPVLVALNSRRATGDDWNFWWSRQLDSYQFLPGDLGDVIELGCGPYTNTRVILRGRTARLVVCSDPLAAEYVGFESRWLARAARKRLIEIDTHPIEECPFPPSSFDVVVLINVLDHVMDAAVCLRIAVDLVRPGGFFIFGQDLSDPKEVDRPEWYDEGHPIKLTLDDVVGPLEEFEPLVQRVLSPEESRDPRTQSGVLVFAGKKRT